MDNVLGNPSHVPSPFLPTCVTKMEYNPKGAVEKTEDAMGLVTQRVEGDLKRFKILSNRVVEKPAPGGAPPNEGGHVEQGRLLIRHLTSLAWDALQVELAGHPSLLHDTTAAPY
jgi:hypothetical protein